jgi:hypothetical protein
MPPNAETVSDSNAERYASAASPRTAAPHGLLCFTITHAVIGRAEASPCAASTSSQLL